MRHTAQKRARQRADTTAATAQSVRRQIAWAAGVQGFAHRDPLYHVTESFGQSFDEIGRRHAAALAGQTGTPRDAADEPDLTDARQLYQTRDPAQQDMVRRFSETTFQRGRMAGAVLQGTGKMMLVSCLKRTVGQSQPVREQQRRLFAGASQQQNIPGRDPDAVVFNRGFAYSAVGLVTDTLRDARRIVDSLAALAAGDSNMGADGGAQTLRQMYPFLDDSREKSLLAQYDARLREDIPPEERRLLQGALARLHALQAKKAQMKNEFINKLRLISDRATEALCAFEAPGAIEEIAQAVDADALPPEEPPDEGGEDGEAHDGTA